MPEQERPEPLFMGGLADYHCHCDYSSDAIGTIEDYCEAALSRGLAEICFATHFDANPSSDGSAEFIRVEGKKLPVSPDSLAPYVDHVRRAHEEFYPRGLSVKVGLEFGWYDGCEEVVLRLQERYGFDHMLCGIHEIDNICFCCQERYEKCLSRYTVEQAVERYIGEITTAVRSSLFDCIAHLDYVRRFGVAYYGHRLDELLLEHCQRSVFPALVETSTPLEVNTSTARRKIENYFPKIALVNAARRAGVDIRFLGSDAHAPGQVGFDFDAAAPLVSHPSMSCDND
jgi:histidinol-phosphatase (PHP family)